MALLSRHSCRNGNNDTPLEDKDLVSLLTYQLSVLKAELDYQTSRRKKSLGPVVEFLQLHARQFCWTMERVKARHFIEPRSRKSLRQTVSFKAASSGRQRAGRLLVDVSNTFSSNAHTGIQRVVKQFADASAEMGVGCAVLIRNGHLLHADESEAKLKPIQVVAGDVLFLLDSNWQRPEAIRLIIKHVQSRGGFVVAGLHDLIPIEFPFTCNEETIRDFTAWLDMALHSCDAFLCVSETTARTLARNARSLLDRRPAPPIGWFTLGTSLPAVSWDSSCDQFASKRPYVLMVGTVEPRKGHPVALHALEKLWKEGVDLDFVIVGRRGWNMRFFEETLRNHPEMSRRLFWMSDASDDDLVRAYRGASALLFPSIAEGYGLPLIEAASFGTRIVVSDLDIFREIAPPGSSFFAPCSSEDLAVKICEYLDGGDDQTSEWCAPTWKQSVERALCIIEKRAYQIDAN